MSEILTVGEYYSCDIGHPVITYYTQPCPLCAMRRHVKAAQELLYSTTIRSGSFVEQAILRLEAAINLAGQRTPDLPRTAA